MKVILRSWQKSDRLILAELANNVKIWNNLRDRLPHPYNIHHADTFIKYCIQQNPPQVLAIEADGKLVGCTGVQMQDDVSRISAELGYWIGEPYWGQGIAGESIKLMTNYAFETFPILIRIYARVFEYNKPSMKALEKNGFYLESIQRQSAIKNNAIVDEYVWVKFR
ncbi:MAG TPA: GNAT family protein [Agriterribacter sp.]|nr:GNAT family protein [Agriterribacter sp.]